LRFAAGVLTRGGAHCTLRAVDRTPEGERRETLLALLDYAAGTSPGDCWGDERAEHLLRSQSTAEELRGLGASEPLIERIFPRTMDGTFSVRVEARFESAHFLREYRGISEPLHGHSYKVEAELAASGGSVDSDAIAVDFVSAKRKLEALAKRLDYGCINDIAPFDEINPTAENIAAWFHAQLSAAVADENAVVRAVTIWEGPVNSVTYKT
jgi:6-pyruvoyltetrahydropterin/6-carboxytetrahydropterin synthase